jgi:hypothetical protein
MAMASPVAVEHWGTAAVMQEPTHGAAGISTGSSEESANAPQEVLAAPGQLAANEKKMAYLPIEVNGNLVLEKVGSNNWRATDQYSQTGAEGVAYRWEKRPDAWRKGQGRLNFGESIEGTDLGDGWVQIAVAQAVKPLQWLSQARRDLVAACSKPFSGGSLAAQSVAQATSLEGAVAEGGIVVTDLVPTKESSSDAARNEASASSIAESAVPREDPQGHVVQSSGGESQPMRVAASPAPVGLPEAPWCIDLNQDLSVDSRWTPVSHLGSMPTAGPAWRCSLMRRTAFSKDSVAGQVWSRWTKAAEDIASQHVARAFAQVGTKLSSLCKGGYDGDVHAMLTLAGSDVDDHEATMHQVEMLVRNTSPTSAIALVTPENFRNLATVTRHICHQLMSGSIRVSPDSDTRDAGEVEADEGQLAEDWGPQQMQRAGLTACMDWFRERRARNPSGPVVLLVERLEAVPKDVLRDTLTSLGMALGSENIPLFVLFGLQHPPQDCLDLFEGKPLVNLRLLGAAHLFDARSISAGILEWLVEDPMSLLVLSPRILDSLRKDRFEYTRQSVSHIMKSLALLCVHFFTKPSTGLCAPLDHVLLQGKKFDEAKLTRVFQKRLENAPDILEHFKPLWDAWDESGADKGPASVINGIAKAAAQATCWRQRLISSLGVWDALSCTLQPLLRHEPRLRRWCRLLEELWPKPSSDDEISLLEAFRAEQDGIMGLLEPCFSCLQDTNSLSHGEVSTLLENLIGASSALDDKLKKEIHEMRCAESKDKELRSGINTWLCRVRAHYWLPLQDAARIVFREISCTQSHDDLIQQVESRLSGKKGFTVESILKPLSIGSNQPSQAPDDLALLYRLLECSTGKSIEVAEVWRAFSDNAVPSPSESDLKLRFGRGLLGLHAIGLFAPQNGGKADTGSSFDHWRLRKKHFGRVWLKQKESAEAESVAELCEAKPVTVAEVRSKILMSKVAGDGQPIEIPDWAKRWTPESLRGNQPPPSLLKRQAPLRGFETAAKRPCHERKPRIFMT